jgi:hemerythrin HHE cation binding domain-containing protein
MQRIIDNLTRQHRELVRTATEMFGWLDADKLRARGAAEVYRALSSLSGILHVHLAMEDRSLYPNLVHHQDLQLRTLAVRFLAERTTLCRNFDDYRARWLSAAAIERDAERFIDDSRLILGKLWTRMKMEDDVLHPEIVRAFAAA